MDLVRVELKHRLNNRLVSIPIISCDRKLLVNLGVELLELENKTYIVASLLIVEARNYRRKFFNNQQRGLTQQLGRLFEKIVSLDLDEIYKFLESSDYAFCDYMKENLPKKSADGRGKNPRVYFAPVSSVVVFLSKHLRDLIPSFMDCSRNLSHRVSEKVKCDGCDYLKWEFELSNISLHHQQEKTIFGLTTDATDVHLCNRCVDIIKCLLRGRLILSVRDIINSIRVSKKKSILSDEYFNICEKVFEKNLVGSFQENVLPMSLWPLKIQMKYISNQLCNFRCGYTKQVVGCVDNGSFRSLLIKCSNPFCLFSETLCNSEDLRVTGLKDRKFVKRINLHLVSSWNTTEKKFTCFEKFSVAAGFGIVGENTFCIYSRLFWTQCPRIALRAIGEMRERVVRDSLLRCGVAISRMLGGGDNENHRWDLLDLFIGRNPVTGVATPSLILIKIYRYFSKFVYLIRKKDTSYESKRLANLSLTSNVVERIDSGQKCGIIAVGIVMSEKLLKDRLETFPDYYKDVNFFEITPHISNRFEAIANKNIENQLTHINCTGIAKDLFVRFFTEVHDGDIEGSSDADKGAYQFQDFKNLVSLCFGHKDKNICKVSRKAGSWFFNSVHSNIGNADEISKDILAFCFHDINLHHYCPKRCLQKEKKNEYDIRNFDIFSRNHEAKFVKKLKTFLKRSNVMTRAAKKAKNFMFALDVNDLESLHQTEIWGNRTKSLSSIYAPEMVCFGVAKTNLGFSVIKNIFEHLGLVFTSTQLHRIKEHENTKYFRRKKRNKYYRREQRKIYRKKKIELDVRRKKLIEEEKKQKEKDVEEYPSRNEKRRRIRISTLPLIEEEDVEMNEKKKKKKKIPKKRKKRVKKKLLPVTLLKIEEKLKEFEEYQDEKDEIIMKKIQKSKKKEEDYCSNCTKLVGENKKICEYCKCNVCYNSKAKYQCCLNVQNTIIIRDEMKFVCNYCFGMFALEDLKLFLVGEEELVKRSLVPESDPFHDCQNCSKCGEYVWESPYVVCSLTVCQRKFHIKECQLSSSEGAMGYSMLSENQKSVFHLIGICESGYPVCNDCCEILRAFSHVELAISFEEMENPQEYHRILKDPKFTPDYTTEMNRQFRIGKCRRSLLGKYREEKMHDEDDEEESGNDEKEGEDDEEEGEDEDISELKISASTARFSYQHIMAENKKLWGEFPMNKFGEINENVSMAVLEKMVCVQCKEKFSVVGCFSFCLCCWGVFHISETKTMKDEDVPVTECGTKDYCDGKLVMVDGCRYYSWCSGCLYSEKFRKRKNVNFK